MKRSLETVLVCAMAASLLTGCIQKVKKTIVIPGECPVEHYEKLKNCHLKLTMVSTRMLFAGSDAKAVFALENVGKKEVVIKEWYKEDDENLKTFCQIWLPGTQEPVDSEWTELERVPVKTPLRYPLRLAPGNRVFLTQKLPFIKLLHLEQGHERRYFLKARLNLESVDVESPVAAIAVRPPAPPRAVPAPKDSAPAVVGAKTAPVPAR